LSCAFAERLQKRNNKSRRLRMFLGG